MKAKALRSKIDLIHVCIVNDYPITAHFKSFWHPMLIQCYRNIVSVRCIYILFIYLFI